MIQIASYQEFQNIKIEQKEHASRLDRIEVLMEHLTHNVSNLQYEMVNFKNEMKDFKDEMQDFKDEMQDFKNEMKDFKNEMKDFKRDAELEHKAMNKRWGEISNKLGTIVEDLINPATSETLKRCFGCEIDYKAINIRKKINNLQGEFDIIASSKECKKVFLIEVKATPRIEYISDFKNKVAPKFRKLFSEFDDYELVLIFASISLKKKIVNI